MTSTRQRRRAHSFSTADGQHDPTEGLHHGAFKVVIERPERVERPKTADLLGATPTLEVPIPSYRLGTPRFSTRGTAFLRGSTCTSSNDVQSSKLTMADSSAPFSPMPDVGLSRRHSYASPLPGFAHMAIPSPDMPSFASPLIDTARLGERIEPAMFDALTFRPACDDLSVVRYSAVTGCICAATPARLVAEITSARFLDYDLLSDFFLTFRSYLEASDLLHMLIARFQWAFARDDEAGMVVRVRTFVAIRHWVLNYFADDYLLDYEQRKQFADAINGIVARCREDGDDDANQLKILDELKKCWRRTCAQYWDSPAFLLSLAPEVPIMPGGIAGSRDASLTPAFWEDSLSGPPQLEAIPHTGLMTTEEYSFLAESSREQAPDVPDSGHPMDSAPDDEASGSPKSPGSTFSDEVMSCSFPTRAMRQPRSGHPLGKPLGAHPVPSGSQKRNVSPVASTPKALSGKRVRPIYTHGRSGSVSDSLRDQRTEPVKKVIHRSKELLLALPYAGSLVRGNLLPPGQATVEAIAPRTPAVIHHTSPFFPPIVSSHQNMKGPSAMSAPGMKKLLYCVRRAITNKTGPSPSASPTAGSFVTESPVGSAGPAYTRTSGTRASPAQMPTLASRTHLRVDLLGAGIAADFQRAVDEVAQAETERNTRSPTHDAATGSGPEVRISAQGRGPVVLRTSSSGRSQKSEATADSDSIIIVDDTHSQELPIVTGTLQTDNVSHDTFTRSFMPPSGGLTPPSTPPRQAIGTPRRSSEFFGQNRTFHAPQLSFDRTPSLIHDVRSAEDGQSPSYRPLGRPSVRSFGVRSFRSRRSTSLRRYASFHSGYTRHMTERSFDATTFSDFLEDDFAEDDFKVGPASRPLRVLRRRPGGDLRAVNNVGALATCLKHRPRSTGSVTTYSDSLRTSVLLGRDSSGFVEVVNGSDYSHAKTPNFSLGALTESKPKAPAVFHPNPSQPVMRPSFEAEAAKLAQIPDDANDDGGVESALLKLEGKFDHTRSTLLLDDSTHDLSSPSQDFDVDPAVFVATSAAAHSGEERRGRRQQPVSDISSDRVASPRTSDVSYSIIPPLATGDLNDKRQRQTTKDWSHVTFLRAPSNDRAEDEDDKAGILQSSVDFVETTAHVDEEPTLSIPPSRGSKDESFLVDESDLSSEMSLEVISRTEYMEEQDAPSTSPSIGPGQVMTEVGLPSAPYRKPPSPPIAHLQTLNLGLDAKQDRKLDTAPVHQNLPPTPDITPVMNSAGFEDSPAHSSKHPSVLRQTNLHLPFILAFDSDVLARQFTLIEKEALNEIDWKELIEMRWKDTANTSRSWVDFLKNQSPRGVEVVIARFNIMVKWAVSECVLTQNLEERVRCVIKYIHIAANCRKYRNYATMYQITVALTSIEITRLTKTFALVPTEDLDTLAELEALVNPSRNFHNLRAEMESVSTEEPCVPFIGIYTQDLLFNAQRPSQIASTPTTEPLVNFDRCRTSAAIIKNLLMLLEASTRYAFKPVEGVTDRCLWMSALDDEEIRALAEKIQ